MPLSPLAAVAAEQSTNKGFGTLQSPNNNKDTRIPSNDNPRTTFISSSSSSSVLPMNLSPTVPAGTTAHTALNDHDHITQSRSALIERYSQFNWNDSSSFLPTLSLSTYKYYLNLSDTRKDDFQRTIHDRYMAAVDHALIRYTKSFQDSKEYKVFAKDINRIRLHVRSMVDENKIGGKLHIPTIINHKLREWMIKDGLITEKTSIMGASGGESSVDSTNRTTASPVPANWLPDTVSSSTENVATHPQRSTTTYQRRNSIKDKVSLKSSSHSLDNKHETYTHIESWQHYPKDYQWSLLHRSQLSQSQPRNFFPSSSSSSSSSSTLASALPTSDEPTFWVGRTIGLGNIQTNFTGGGNKSGGDTERKKQDPTTMRSLWAAERGIITTLPNLQEGMNLALEKNELRMLDPAGANLASVMGPAESADAYLDMAKHRWQHEPAQLHTDTVHSTASSSGGAEFHDPLNVPLHSSSSVTIRSAFTSNVVGDPPGNSENGRTNVSLASVNSRMNSNQMRQYLMQRTEAIIEKLQQAGALMDETTTVDDQRSVPYDGGNGNDPSTSNTLLPYPFTASSLSSSLPIGTRLAVQETVPGITTRIMQPKEGIISVSFDNLTNNNDTRNPLREDANVELRDGKLETIPYLPIVPNTVDNATANSTNEGENTKHIPDTPKEGVESIPRPASSSRSLHHRPASSLLPQVVVVPMLESTDFSSFVTIQQNTKGPTGPVLSSAGSNRLTTKGRRSSVTSNTNNTVPAKVTAIVPAPVYRDPQVAHYLAHAARPLPSVDHINIHANNRIAPKKEGIDRPSTPRTLNDSIEYRYTKGTSPVGIPSSVNDNEGLQVATVPSIVSSNIPHPSRSPSSPQRPSQEPWYYKQGYSPGIALAPTNPSSTAALLGPVAAEKLRKEKNVKDATEYLLHRVIGARAGASHRSRQLSRNPQLLYSPLAGKKEEEDKHGVPNFTHKLRTKPLSPSPVDILQSYVNNNNNSSSSYGNPRDSGSSMEENSMYSNETSSTVMVENALEHSNQRIQEQRSIVPEQHQTHSSLMMIVKNKEDNTLDPKVSNSLAELSSVLLKSQALPVSYATRVRGLGSLAASRPLPFKLSPIEPRKPISLIKKGMYDTIYTG